MVDAFEPGLVCTSQGYLRLQAEFQKLSALLGSFLRTGEGISVSTSLCSHPYPWSFIIISICSLACLRERTVGLQWYQLAHLVETVFKNIHCPSVWKEKSISVNEVVFPLTLAVCSTQLGTMSVGRRGELYSEWTSA